MPGPMGPRPGRTTEKAKDFKGTTKKLINNYLSKYKIGLIIVFIFAVGSTVNIALDAKVELEKSGINVRVVDLYSIKPVDEEEILKSAKQTEKLVSIEDHSVIGGIGSIIESVLCKRYPKKLVKLGVKDIFGKSGKPDELYAMYGITKEEIIKNFI